MLKVCSLFIAVVWVRKLSLHSLAHHVVLNSLNCDRNVGGAYTMTATNHDGHSNANVKN